MESLSLDVAYLKDISKASSALTLNMFMKNEIMVSHLR